ncbi:uncharacterized protein SCHCODRAFT_02246370 [Schizophyllum commune H4-8]|uniref:uncharacterized protein n=1 Tax=Schizophyllum commune (strain H4-8 / FGSC 9210) TaxID=578458 RepID=UPI00215E419B|nr:uncharacterized protein SCHCODRAFT_02246370 [Schizophyllum commune H4-8]KAI5893157.1 hypothetical protein SCHCODRAFT_02246370 [Schizophyllum commune H4-8]
MPAGFYSNSVHFYHSPPLSLREQLETVRTLRRLFCNSSSHECSTRLKVHMSASALTIEHTLESPPGPDDLHSTIYPIFLTTAERSLRAMPTFSFSSSNPLDSELQLDDGSASLRTETSHTWTGRRKCTAIVAAEKPVASVHWRKKTFEVQGHSVRVRRAKVSTSFWKQYVR